MLLSVRTRGVRLAKPLILSIGLLLAGCSGDITGDVYVTMKSGDVKRGADVEIALLRDEFMTEWKKGSESFRPSWQEAHAAYEDAQAVATRALELRLATIRNGYNDPGGWEEANARATDAAKRADDIMREWKLHSLKLAEWATVRTVRTDVNGRYEINGVRHGKYYLMASHRVFDNELHWIVPVEVRGPVKVDLSNSNNTSLTSLLTK